MTQTNNFSSKLTWHMINATLKHDNARMRRQKITKIPVIMASTKSHNQRAKKTF